MATGSFVLLTLVGIGLRTQAQRQEVAQAPVVAEQAAVVTVNVPEMDCAGCEVGVKIAASKTNGVKKVKTDSDARTAVVSFDPSKTNAEAIASAITKGTGFKTEVPKSGKTT
jgi:mercuric ion binding protein